MGSPDAVAARERSEAPAGAARRRIVVVHPSDEMYGADRMLLQVLTAVGSLPDVDVEVWLPSDVPHVAHPLCAELSHRGIAWRHADTPVLRRAYMRPSGLLRLTRSIRTLRRELRDGHIDLLLCGTSACLLAAPLARSVGIRHRVVHVQERWEGGVAVVLRALAKTTTARIAISRAVADASRLDGPTPVVIENCVDEPDAPVTPVDRDSTAGLRFVVASRWNAWKGHETLLRAWDAADCPGTLVVLGGPPPVGDAVDVPALVELHVRRPETVEIVGEVPDAGPFIAEADVLVLPSDAPEPFGLVLIEAFARSRPVVASRAGGPLEIVDDGVDGWLYEPGNHAALAEVLRGLDRARVADAGARGRQTYEARYEPTRYHARVRDFLTAELDR